MAITNINECMYYTHMHAYTTYGWTQALGWHGMAWHGLAWLGLDKFITKNGQQQYKVM